MTATNAIDLRLEGNAHACTIMLWEHFLEYPPLLHDYFSQGYDPRRVDIRVLDLTGTRENRRVCEFEVCRPDDLLRLTQDLLGRLLLFRATMHHERVTKENKYVSRRDYWRDDFAVLLNLQHEELRDQMKSRLDKAMDDMVKGKKFCLEMNFGNSLIDWYSERVDGKRSDMEYIYPTMRAHQIDFISLVIHNCSTPINCCMSLWTISLCFPLWLILGGSCYYVYRKARVTEMRDDVEVPIKFRMTDTNPPEFWKRGLGLTTYRRMQTTGLSSRGLVDKMKCMGLVGS